jgi:archaellum component FlaF (FlaF/FlaG flagellin family)
MSKFTDIQDQYKCYVVAKSAVEKTKPNIEKVVYANHETVNLNSTDNGFFIYYPEKGCIELASTGKYSSGIAIAIEDIPALIKALRDFFE